MAKTVKKTPKKSAVKTKTASNDFLENANMVHALSYFPYFIGAVSMYFLGKSDKKKSLHHIKYSVIIALAVIVLSLVLNAFFVKLMALAYLALSAYLAWKAYNGEEVKVEILDTIEDKISEIKIKK